MKQIGFHNLNFALGVCSGPQGPVIDLPIFGEAASSREGLGGSQPLSIWRPACPFGGLGAPNPCPFGDRHVHLEGWPTFGDRLSMWKTALSIPKVGGPTVHLHLEGWGAPSSCPFGDRLVHLEGWGGPQPLSVGRPLCPFGAGQPLKLSGEPLNFVRRTA